MLDRVRSELNTEHVSPGRHLELLDEGIAANDQLLERLEETLAESRRFETNAWNLGFVCGRLDAN